MLIFNYILTLLAIWLLFKINNRFIRPASWNTYRFKLFEIRDRLALLAMNGKLREDSDEYRKFISLINFSVNETSDYSTSKLIQLGSKLTELNSIVGKLENTVKHNNIQFEFLELFGEYTHTISKMYIVKTRLLRKFYTVFIWLLNVIQIMDRFKKLVIILSKQIFDSQSNLEELDTRIGNLRKTATV